VARELKYHSPNTDLEALQRELATGGSKSRDDYAELGEVDAEADDEDDEYDDSPSDSDWRSRGR
jgi:hypothetical protein